MLGSLLGNYRVVDKLGEGGMGVVYVGQHEALGHRVVVKVLLAALSSHRDMVQRFFNEARAATAIRNPGIVQVFDFGVTGEGRAYFVMELLEGETLGARLRKRRFDAAECCRLGRQVANVLQAAHAAGITHRDLKPDNLFLIADPEVAGGERVKVLDFGIAKLAGEFRSAGIATHTDLVMGTPDYMSPEQCRSASVADARSDVYSLGCILFQAACGRPPFARPGIGDVVGAHLHDPPPQAHRVAPDVPPALSAVIDRMLAKHPDARPQTMAAVSQLLDEALRASGGAIAAGAPGAPHRGSPPPAGSGPFPAAIGAPAAAIVPVLSPSSTTLSAASHFTSSPAGSGRRRLPVVLASAIVATLVAIAVVAATRPSSSPALAPGKLVSYDDIAAQRRSADVAASPASAPASPAPAAAPPAPAAAQPAPGAPPPSAPAPAPVTAPASPPSESPVAAPSVPSAAPSAPAQADALMAECRGIEVSRKWDALAECAGRLQPLDAPRAAEFSARSAGELRSAPMLAAAQSALKDKDLKRARAALAQVWPGSADYPKLKRAYEVAEAQEIDALATELDSVKDATCGAFNQAVAKARSASPSRVVAEALRRTSCTAAPSCDADALTDRGGKQFSAGQLAEALAAFEAAYACRPSPPLLQKQFVVVCNLRDLPKARSLWKRLSPTLRKAALGVCVRNGITADSLDGA